MSQYSEMMGSFIRTGNYPMEANYVFPTEAALKEFYSDPINATTIHKGLFRIVENGGDGKQALYWVVQKQTNDELEFVKLIENIDINNINEQLEDLQTRLEEEISNRKESETAIWGTDSPTQVPDDLNSLLDIAEAIISLRNELQEESERAQQEEGTIKESIQYIVGTTQEDVISYIKANLDYKSLSELSNALNKFLNSTDNSNNIINTLPELQSFLSGFKDNEVLKNVLQKIVDDIMGDPIPSQEFRTFRSIEDFIRTLQANLLNITANIQSEVDQTQIGVGLSGDGSFNADQETYYLKQATSVMNALKILDSLINEATTQEQVLTHKIEDEVSRATREEQLLQSAVNSKISQIGVLRVSDLEYNITADGVAVGTISIPKDEHLIDASYDSLLKILTFKVITKDGEKTIQINISDLVDTYTSGDGLSLSNNQFSVQIDPNSERYITVSSQGIKFIGLDEIGTLTNKINTNLEVEIARAKAAEAALEEKYNTFQETYQEALDKKADITMFDWNEE